MTNPWELDEFADFLNDINDLITNKYGWNVGGYEYAGERSKNTDIITLLLIPACGVDEENRKF